MDSQENADTVTNILFNMRSKPEAGKEALADNLANMTELCFWQQNLAPEEVKKLSEALATNASLTSLNLGNNQIDDTGAQHLTQALMTNTSLTCLNLRGNQIDSMGMQYLAQALTINKSLTRLDLRENWLSSADTAALAKAIHSLSHRLVKPSLLIFHKTPKKILKAFDFHKRHMKQQALGLGVTFSPHLPESLAGMVVDYLGVGVMNSPALLANFKRGLKRPNENQDWVANLPKTPKPILVENCKV